MNLHRFGYPDKPQLSTKHPPLTADEETKVDQLFESVNKTAEVARGVHLTFLLISLYIAIIIGSTTHKQLLLESDITLPLLSVGLPIVKVYIVVPWLFVLLHMNVFIIFYMLSRKIYQTNITLKSLLKDESRVQEITRCHLYPLPFAQWITNKQEGRTAHFLFFTYVFSTSVLIPVVLLLWAQVRFLPYHSEWITWSHRLTILADLTILHLFWMMIRDEEGRISGALTRQINQNKRSFVLWASAYILLTITVIIISLSIATFPNEDFNKNINNGWIAKISSGYSATLEYVRKIPGTDQITNWFNDNFPRNLDVQDEILVKTHPSPAILAAFMEKNKTKEDAYMVYASGIDLKGRNLRNANLSGSKLYNANFYAISDGKQNYVVDLREANLTGTNLHRANLQNANLQRATLDFSNLQGTTLKGANLQGSLLMGANMLGAFIEGANLQGARLAVADFQGANLVDAKLHGADLRGAKMQGAILNRAKLIGTDFFGANLRGASFMEAEIFGTNFRDTDLSYSNFKKVKFNNNVVWKDIMDELISNMPQNKLPVHVKDTMDLAKKRVLSDKDKPAKQIYISDKTNLHYILFDQTSAKQFSSFTYEKVSPLNEGKAYTRTSYIQNEIICSHSYITLNLAFYCIINSDMELSKLVIDSNCLEPEPGSVPDKVIEYFRWSKKILEGSLKLQESTKNP
ncbi:MAG: pentapeptide repeat-containing protein [Magnetococcales bacterium]|nr:pentapeptide repeat-containing protein [Magnetococcales bacterium]